MPDLPRGSSAAPTLYQTIWVTAGTRWFGSTTTCRPLPSIEGLGRETLRPRAAETAQTERHGRHQRDDSRRTAR